MTNGTRLKLVSIFFRASVSNVVMSSSIVVVSATVSDFSYDSVSSARLLGDECRARLGIGK